MEGRGEDRHALDVLAQAAVAEAAPPALHAIAQSVLAVGTVERARRRLLKQHSEEAERMVAVHGPAALVMWFQSRQNATRRKSAQLAYYPTLCFPADVFQALNHVYLRYPAGGPAGSATAQWQAINKEGEKLHLHQLYSQETVKSDALPFAEHAEYKDAHGFKHVRLGHNYANGKVNFDEQRHVHILYAEAHIQLYDLLARWVHYGGLAAEDATFHDDRHLVLLSIAMLMEQEEEDARHPPHEPLETKLHVAVLSEPDESRKTILSTLLSISQQALKYCSRWNPANPQATPPWVVKHQAWCERLHQTTRVSYEGLSHPGFYLGHMQRAVEICKRILHAHAPRPVPQVPLPLAPGQSGFMPVARAPNAPAPLVHVHQQAAQAALTRQQILGRRRMADAIRAARSSRQPAAMLEAQRAMYENLVHQNLVYRQRQQAAAGADAGRRAPAPGPPPAPRPVEAGEPPRVVEPPPRGGQPLNLGPSPRRRTQRPRGNSSSRRRPRSARDEPVQPRAEDDDEED